MKRTGANGIRKITGRTISLVSIMLFIFALLIMIFSNIYMNVCIEREADARQSSAELSDLGESLADTSDYLTNEARRFSVTGDITHLYNYWHEVNVTQTRDSVIDKLSSYEPPRNEQDMLSSAKQYSDMLIGTETVSMRLMLKALGKTSVDYFYNEELYGYVLNVEQCELPQEYEEMSPEDMRFKSTEILYDAFYTESKSLIMTPIGEFQSVMNERLNKQVEEAEQGRAIASFMQLIGSAAMLAFTGILVVAVNIMYIRPINRYSAALSESNVRIGMSDSDFSRVRVSPDGAFELYRFGEIFNHLALILYKEIKNHAEAEEKMRSARDEADRANAAKTDFFARMSHELRTPLNAITGYLYLLEDAVQDDEQKKYCKGIEISADNLLGLINNVLDFSKIESGSMLFEQTDFSLKELMEDVYSITEISAEQKGLKLELELFGDLPEYVKGDSLRLKQVLINLAGNAVKFTDHGSVRISAEYAGESGGRSVIEFGVRDTGIGISREDAEKIFEPFVQSDVSVTRKYGGTGLGLPIADRIVREASGGKYHLELESEVGAGSYFHFRAEFKKGNAVPSIKEQTAEVCSESGKILLVDDNKINLDIEKEILRSFGLEVLTAESGAEALEKAENDIPDMILLDLHMPDMDGYETAAKIRLIESCRITPIVVLTADVVSGTAERVLSSGINDYLSKPFKPEKLGAVIEKYLNIRRTSPEMLIQDVGDCFKINEALRNIGGSSDTLADIVRRFLNSQKHSCNYIKSHIRSGNLGNARAILHDIKGTAGNMCCYRLSDSAAELMKELDNREYSSLESFSEIFDKTMSELKDYAEKNPAADVPYDESGDFEEIWRVFIKMCTDCDISAAEHFSKHRVLFRNALDSNIYRLIEESVRRYDFEAVTEKVNSEGVNIHV